MTYKLTFLDASPCLGDAFINITLHDSIVTELCRMDFIKRLAEIQQNCINLLVFVESYWQIMHRNNNLSLTGPPFSKAMLTVLPSGNFIRLHVFIEET